MKRGVLLSAGGLASGLLFGMGLVMSGMTQPAKVRAFLDVFGVWDPSLAFVMLGAIGVHALALRAFARRSAPLAGGEFSQPPPPRVDGRLVFGSALFGVGWAMSGYCPGPSLVALPASGAPGAVFVVSLALGNVAVSALKWPRFRRAPSAALQS